MAEDDVRPGTRMYTRADLERVALAAFAEGRQAGLFGGRPDLVEAVAAAVPGVVIDAQTAEMPGGVLASGERERIRALAAARALGGSIEQGTIQALVHEEAMICRDAVRRAEPAAWAAWS